MPIGFDCGGCGTHYEVGEGLAGKRGTCKKCGSSMVIPDRTSSPSPAAPAVTFSDEDDGLPYGTVEPPPPPPPPPPDPEPAGTSKTKGKKGSARSTSKAKARGGDSGTVSYAVKVVITLVLSVVAYLVYCGFESGVLLGKGPKPPAAPAAKP